METSDGKAFLCHICDVELTGIIRMREKLKSSSSTVSAKLQCLTLTVGCSKTARLHGEESVGSNAEG